MTIKEGDTLTVIGTPASLHGLTEDNFNLRPGTLWLKAVHKQVALYHPGAGDFVAVDEGMAPLLTCLWLHGVETHGSCENGADVIDGKEEQAWVSFPTFDDAARFKKLTGCRVQARWIPEATGVAADGLPMTGGGLWAVYFPPAEIATYIDNIPDLTV